MTPPELPALVRASAGVHWAAGAAAVTAGGMGQAPPRLRSRMARARAAEDGGREEEEGQSG